MNAIKLTTKARAMTISHDNCEVFGFSLCDGGCELCVMYDFRDRPLILGGRCEVGDEVEIRILPYRIELWIKGALVDEEWPCGNLLASDAELADIGFVGYTPEKRCEPSVLYSFENAEGWRPGGSVFVGDCMPYVDEGRYHVLYLKDRRHHKSKWHLGAHQWEHISTSDFVKWDVHPMAVEIDDPMEGSICTGSHLRTDKAHYLYYTVRMSDGSSAPIKRSVSYDGYHFEKDRDFAFRLSEKYHGASARDPKVFVDDNGIYHMLLTTSLTADKRGCLAHLTSRDTQTWVEEEQPIYISDDTSQPECPDYFKLGGLYYLVYSLHGQANYKYSEKPFTEWKTPDDPIIRCERVPKAGIIGGKIIFTGFVAIDGYGGTMTFRTAHTENGVIILD